MHAEPTILFDKSGRMTKIKDTLTHTSHISIWNQVEYVPPIEKPITLQLKNSKTYQTVSFLVYYYFIARRKHR